MVHGWKLGTDTMNVQNSYDPGSHIPKNFFIAIC